MRSPTAGLVTWWPTRPGNTSGKLTLPVYFYTPSSHHRHLQIHWAVKQHSTWCLTEAIQEREMDEDQSVTRLLVLTLSLEIRLKIKIKQPPQWIHSHIRTHSSHVSSCISRLNEGHTVYLERMIGRHMESEQFRQFKALGGWKELQDSVSSHTPGFIHKCCTDCSELRCVLPQVTNI